MQSASFIDVSSLKRPCVTGFQVESGGQRGDRKIQGDVKRCVATGDRTRVSGISLLCHNRWTTAARYHRPTELLTFQGSCYTILLPSTRRPARASKPSSAASEWDSKWSRGSERRQEDSGTSKDVSQPGIEPGSLRLSGISLLRHGARPPQHDTTGPRHRAFDVFQGSCYTTGKRGSSRPGSWRWHWCSSAETASVCTAVKSQRSAVIQFYGPSSLSKSCLS